MSRIRDLLVGPVIADEQARHDQSVGRLDQALADQSETIAALKARIGELEQAQCAEIERLDLRLLGMMEALLVDQQSLRARLAENEQLKPYLDGVAERAKGSETSG